ncbi:MAG: porin, partial [Proteobacteria bacterium]|nr:porin [Pseudomonadota bacterium]
MKKFTIAALALCLAFALATPAMAVDANFSGYYFVRGVYVQQWDLRDTSENNAFMNMRFRLQTVFKASDILSVTARFDALDGHVWGTTTDTTGGTANNLNFERAYMTIKAPIGTFDIGRQKGGTFGTTFVDSEGDADRIKYTKVIDNLTILAIFEKVSEKDNVTTAGTAAGDADSDKYALAAIQKMENLTVGVLGAFTNDKTSGSVSTATGQSTTRKYALNPYFVGKFGPLNIQGELSYGWGTKDYDAAATTDIDYKTLAYNVEGSFNLGAATVLAGYAFISGENSNTTELTAAGGVGNDWEKLFILTTNEVPALTQLGNVGNVSKDGVTYMTG